MNKQINSLFVPLDCYLVGCVVECRRDLATFSGETDEASFLAPSLVQVVGSIDESERDAGQVDVQHLGVQQHDPLPEQ